MGTATTGDFRQECAWTGRKKIFLEYNDTGGMAGFKAWEPGRDQIIEGFVDLNNGLGEERNDSHDDIDDSDLDDVDDDDNSTKKKQDQCIHLICASILLIFDIHCSHLSFLKKNGEMKVISILHKRNQGSEMLANCPKKTRLNEC